MSDDTVAVFEDRALDKGLAKTLRKMGKRRARSHGNYLPALDAVLEVLYADAVATKRQLFLIFLSDGAPRTTPNGLQARRAGLAAVPLGPYDEPESTVPAEVSDGAGVPRATEGPRREGVLPAVAPHRRPRRPRPRLRRHGSLRQARRGLLGAAVDGGDAARGTRFRSSASRSGASKRPSRA